MAFQNAAVKNACGNERVIHGAPEGFAKFIRVEYRCIGRAKCGMHEDRHVQPVNGFVERFVEVVVGIASAKRRRDAHADEAVIFDRTLEFGEVPGFTERWNVGEAEKPARVALLRGGQFEIVELRAVEIEPRLQNACRQERGLYSGCVHIVYLRGQVGEDRRHPRDLIPIAEVDVLLGPRYGNAGRRVALEIGKERTGNIVMVAVDRVWRVHMHRG